MSEQTYYQFILSSHPNYTRYHDDWQLAARSYYGGVEFRDGQYLKAYDNDFSTPSEVINTYDMDEYGNQTNQYRTQVNRVNSSTEANSGTGYASNFYQEKLQNVPVFPYTRLYVSEYNAILFRSPPTRELPDSELVDQFLLNADGDQNSINEFMSQVDTFTSVFGVVWVSCIKPNGADYPKWRMHKPTDVLNWSYKYDSNGDLELSKILIRVSSEPNMEVLQYITKDTIDMIFMPRDADEDISHSIPEEAVYESGDEEDEGFYRISQPNELGYIPVRPVYQSTPIHKGIGHTPIFDISQNQRNIYNLYGEIYTTVSYGAHPVVVVDEETLNRNDNSVGAGPGEIIITQQALNGQPNFTFEFVSPSLEALSQLRELIDQGIDKMNQVAMIRSDDLIKASRSGAQIEQYDSKLEAFIRKKATSLEQAEYNLWRIWFDWMDIEMPNDVQISYNRLYSMKGLEHEINEMNMIIGAYEKYNSAFMQDVIEFTARDFSTPEEAQAEAQRLGGDGFHEHELEDGSKIYMPFPNHKEYELRLELANGGDQEELQGINMQGIKEDLRDKIANRLKQLLEGSYSSNSL